MNKLRDEIHQIAREKGWYDDNRARNIPEALALIHSEVSEALEDYRNTFDQNCLRDINVGHGGKPFGFSVELADVIIRCLDLAGYLEIDIDEAIRVKVAYNRTRPHRHGKKC